MGLIERLARRVERTSRPWRSALVAGDRIEALPAVARLVWRSRVTEVATPELAAATVVPNARPLRRATYRPPEGTAALLERPLFDARHHVVLTGRRRLLMDSVSTGDHRYLVGLRQMLLGRERPLAGTFTTFRSFRNTYYHTLIDNLPRLFLLEQARAAFGADPELLCGSGLSDVERYLVERLAPGAKVRVLEPAVPYRAERFVFLGFLTRTYAGWLPPEYLEWLRARVAPARPSAKNRRLWISRRVIAGRHMRNVTNEAEVMAALEPLGFESVRLEELPIERQIELFYDADMVVAPHGAGLANLVFGSGARVIELFPSRWIVPHYHLLSRACGHEHRWLTGAGAHRDSNFAVDVPELLRQVGRSGGV